jgi:hypothetical protein
MMHPLTSHLNGSVRVELSGQRTTSDSGVQAPREALDSSGVIPVLEANLVDPRNPQRVDQNKESCVIVDKLVSERVEYLL